MTLSAKDKKLINELISNGRVSLEKISKAVGLPLSTIHRRLKNLEKKGLIKGYEPIIDYSQLGYMITLFLIIDLHEGVDNSGTINSLKKFKNVVEVDLLQGSEFDVLVKARCRHLKEAHELITEVMKLNGVEEVNSMVSGLSEKETLVFPLQ